MLRLLLILLPIISGPIFDLSIAFAELQEIFTEATYTMGDGETAAFAEAMVLQKAKQQALEKAGTYVESYTKVQNMDLTTEQITTIAGGIIKTEVIKRQRTLVGDGVRFDIAIKATVNPDNIADLIRALRNRDIATQYKKLQEQYSLVIKQLTVLKAQLVNAPSVPERNAALDKIQENEKTFRSLQGTESALLTKLVSGQALVAEAKNQLSQKDSEKAFGDDLLDRILRQGIEVEIGQPQIKMSIQNPRIGTMNLPVTLKRTPLVATVLDTSTNPKARVLKAKDIRYSSAAYGSAIVYGDDKEVRSHLVHRISNLRVFIEMETNDGNKLACYSRYPVRLIEVGGLDSYLFGWLFKNYGDPPYVLFVHETPETQKVDIRLSLEFLERVTSVSGKIVEKDFVHRQEECKQNDYEEKY